MGLVGEGACGACPCRILPELIAGFVPYHILIAVCLLVFRLISSEGAMALYSQQHPDSVTAGRFPRLLAQSPSTHRYYQT